MSKNSTKSHVFNTRKHKATKHARPHKAGKGFLPVESLTALLCEMPFHDTTMAVSRDQAQELRAKIISASTTVLVSHSSSLDESHTSDTTPSITKDIACSMSEAPENYPLTMESPNTKQVPDIFSRPILPPAFLPLYSNERSLRAVALDSTPELPAYARPSMSSWYNSASNLATQGTPLGLPPAGTALRRLNGGRGDRALCRTSSRRSRSNLNTLVDAPNPNMAAENSDVASGQKHDGAVDVSIITTSTQATVTSTDVHDCLTSVETPIPEPETTLAFGASVLDSDVTLWFEPERLLPIDPNFSESEDEAEDDVSPVQAKSSSKPFHRPDKNIPREDLTTPKPHVKRGVHHNVLRDDVAYTAYDSDESPTAVSGCSIRGSSASSHTSQSSIEFHLDNTFVGSTSVRDIIDRLRNDSDSTFTKRDFARAWILCVADEHADRRSVSPSIEAPGISLINPSDVDKALSFNMQRRAKLGRISLFAFLKKFQFDAEGKVAVDVLLPIFRQASVDSQERSETSRHSSTSEVIHRMSIKRSNS